MTPAELVEYADFWLTYFSAIVSAGCGNNRDPAEGINSDPAELAEYADLWLTYFSAIISAVCGNNRDPAELADKLIFG